MSLISVSQYCMLPVLHSLNVKIRIGEVSDPCILNSELIISVCWLECVLIVRTKVSVSVQQELELLHWLQVEFKHVEPAELLVKWIPGEAHGTRHCYLSL